MRNGDLHVVQLVVFDENDIDLKGICQRRQTFAWGLNMHEFLKAHFDLTKSDSTPLYKISALKVSEIKGLKTSLQPPLFTLHFETKRLCRWSVAKLSAALRIGKGLEQMAHKVISRRGKRDHNCLLIFGTTSEPYKKRTKRQRLNLYVQPRAKPTGGSSSNALSQTSSEFGCTLCAREPTSAFDSSLWKAMGWIFQCRHHKKHYICPRGEGYDRHACHDFLAYCFLQQAQLMGMKAECIRSVHETDRNRVLESVWSNWKDLCKRFPTARLCWINGEEITCPRCAFAMHGKPCDREYEKWVTTLMESFAQRSSLEKWWKKSLEKALKRLTRGDPKLERKLRLAGLTDKPQKRNDSDEQISVSEVESGSPSEVDCSAPAESQHSRETIGPSNSGKDCTDDVWEAFRNQSGVKSVDNDRPLQSDDRVSDSEPPKSQDLHGRQSFGVSTGIDPIECQEISTENGIDEKVGGPSDQKLRWIRNESGTGVELVVISSEMEAANDTEQKTDLEVEVTSNSADAGGGNFNPEPSSIDLEQAIMSAYPLALSFDDRKQLQKSEIATCVCCQDTVGTYPLYFENCMHSENHSVCLLSETKAVKLCVLKTVLLWRISLTRDISKVNYSKVKLFAPCIEERAYRMYSSSMNSEWFNNKCPICAWKSQKLKQSSIDKCLECLESRLRVDPILRDWKFVHGL
ncbi:hypothetical protein BSKO_07200 [Bryopsis sp. KO-2023]|nr:hypothetical protein BSKO_07200 [Bryopsis sp. KO-2023]